MPEFTGVPGYLTETGRRIPPQGGSSTAPLTTGPSLRALALSAIAEAYRNQVQDAFDSLVNELGTDSKESPVTNFRESLETAGIAYQYATEAIQRLMPS